MDELYQIISEHFTNMYESIKKSDVHTYDDIKNKIKSELRLSLESVQKFDTDGDIHL